MENECKNYLSTGPLNFIIVVWSDGGPPGPPSESAPAPRGTCMTFMGWARIIWIRENEKHTENENICLKNCSKSCLFGIVVSISDCHPRDPGFDSRLYPGKFSGNIGSGTWFTQPHEDNWVATWLRSREIRLRKLKLRLRDKRFAKHKAPCSAIWQQPLQSILALRSYSATDLLFFYLQ